MNFREFVTVKTTKGNQFAIFPGVTLNNKNRAARRKAERKAIKRRQRESRQGVKLAGVVLPCEELKGVSLPSEELQGVTLPCEVLPGGVIL